jgi:hypothetical protein
LQAIPLIGRQTATALCAPCHQIGETRHDGPPSFVDVANMTSTTDLSLKVFLRSNHKEMSNLIISNSETDNLIAYILNLRQQPFQNSWASKAQFNGVGRLGTYISFTHPAL